MPAGDTTQVRQWLDRCRAGSAADRDALLAHTRDRLAAVARKTRRDRFDFLRNEFETDELTQELYLRLLKRWEEFTVPPPGGEDPARHYFAFAARLVRDILSDAVRKRFGRGKVGRAPAASLDALRDGSSPAVDPGGETHDPERIAMWADVHKFVGELPEPLREVADLHWYHDLTHAEVGEVLGIAEVTSRTRWAKVRHELVTKFPDSPFDWAA